MKEQINQWKKQLVPETGQQGTVFKAVPWRQVFIYFKPHWKVYLVIMTLAILATGLSMVYPLATQIVLDDLITGTGSFWQVALVGGVVLTIFGMILSGINGYLFTKTTLAVLLTMRLKLFGQILSLSPRVLLKHRVGELLTRLNKDLSDVQKVASELVLTLFTSVLTILISLGFLLWLSWQMALATILLFPIALWIMHYLQPGVVAQAARVRENQGKVAGFVAEALQNNRVLQAFALEEQTGSTLYRDNVQLNKGVLKLQVHGGIVSALPRLLLVMGSAGIFLYGGQLVLAGQISLGGLVAFAIYQTRLLAPMQGLLGLYLQVRQSGVAWQRIADIEQTSRDTAIKSGSQDCKGVMKEITLEGIWFAHQRERPVVKDLNLSIPVGQVVALVGQSGSGKSTLADLLIRLYDPDRGRITLDGIDLKEFKLKSLREKVVLAGQEILLFQATVWDNLKLVNLAATEAEVLEVARVTGLHALVSSWPKGYDTQIGERGEGVSGGQKQRLALARALLRNPDVLILDEAMTGLDELSFKQVLRDVIAFMKGKTVILITHRLQPGTPVDRIVKLEEGQAFPEVS